MDIAGALLGLLRLAKPVSSLRARITSVIQDVALKPEFLKKNVFGRLNPQRSWAVAEVPEKDASPSDLQTRHQLGDRMPQAQFVAAVELIDRKRLLTQREEFDQLQQLIQAASLRPNTLTNPDFVFSVLLTVRALSSSHVARVYAAYFTSGTRGTWLNGSPRPVALSEARAGDVLVWKDGQYLGLADSSSGFVTTTSSDPHLWHMSHPEYVGRLDEGDHSLHCGANEAEKRFVIWIRGEGKGEPQAELDATGGGQVNVGQLRQEQQAVLARFNTELARAGEGRDEQGRVARARLQSRRNTVEQDLRLMEVMVKRAKRDFIEWIRGYDRPLTPWNDISEFFTEKDRFYPLFLNCKDAVFCLLVMSHVISQSEALTYLDRRRGDRGLGFDWDGCDPVTPDVKRPPVFGTMVRVDDAPDASYARHVALTLDHGLIFNCDAGKQFEPEEPWSHFVEESRYGDSKYRFLPLERVLQQLKS